MDVLSDVLTAMRTGQPHSARNVKSTTRSERFEAFAGAGFHVVLQGTCRLMPERGDPAPLGAGDVICVLPHHPGYELAHETAPTVLLCGAYLLDQTRPHPLLAELPEIIHVSARIGRHPALRAVIDLLAGELEQPRQGTDAVVPALLDTLLLYILRAWYDQQTDRHETYGWAAALNDPPVAAALAAMHSDPGHEWTVETLGAQAGLSRAAFARRFAGLVGWPPLSYLTWWRMTVAARLLRDTDVPLRSVAARAGYASEFAFAKAFKREHGTSPGAYRRER